MTNFSNPYLITAFNFMEEQTEITKGLKQRAINRYTKALALPRKQKKREKKQANLEYSIACWGENILTF